MQLSYGRTGGGRQGAAQAEPGQGQCCGSQTLARRYVGFYRTCSGEPLIHGWWIKNTRRPVKWELQINFG